MHELHVPLYSLAPFALLLLSIAVMPLVASHWWDHNKNKAIVAGVLAVPVAVWLVLSSPDHLLHSLHEYASFLALLGALYVIAGGIHIGGDLLATPRNNTVLLLVGAVLANLVGTTGASMVLIRLMLRTNAARKNVDHLPFFFILVVSNCGGLLTPLGDPPLFLGYLRGVPFTWTFSLWPVWCVVIGYLLTLFFVLDRRAYAKESKADIARDVAEEVPVTVLGWVNVALLGGVIGAVFLGSPWRELAMVALAGASLVFGSKPARQKNEFDFHPIIEVAVVFAGIFVTMVPALALLETKGAELGLRAPWQFFLVTGALSSVLDNAPTYLTFLSAAQSLGMSNEIVGVSHQLLAAISTGAVLMGANTYIGNGPNFMVKAIADRSGYRTASFGRHALTALVVLTPAYVLTLLYLQLAY